MIVAAMDTSLRAVLDAATGRLAQAGIATARADAEWLLAGLRGIGRAELALDLDRVVEPAVAGRYAAALARREQREPLQRILGWEEFYGLRFVLTPDVLVPRPETEQLVELALAVLPLPGRRLPVVVDVGTGSGCIACAVAHARVDAQVVAIEPSAPALAVARRNVWALGLTDRVRLVAGEFLAAVGSQQVTLVIANPPYLPTDVLASLMPEVRDHEPRLALDGGVDGLDVVRPLVADARRSLRPGGALVLETAGGAQAREVATLLTGAGFTNVAVRADLTGTERSVAGHWPGKGEVGAVSSAGFAGAVESWGRSRRGPSGPPPTSIGGEAPLRAR